MYITNSSIEYPFSWHLGLYANWGWLIDWRKMQRFKPPTTEPIPLTTETRSSLEDNCVFMNGGKAGGGWIVNIDQRRWTTAIKCHDQWMNCSESKLDSPQESLAVWRFTNHVCIAYTPAVHDSICERFRCTSSQASMARSDEGRCILHDLTEPTAYVLCPTAEANKQTPQRIPTNNTAITITLDRMKTTF